MADKRKRPDEILPGDVIVPSNGPYASRKVRVRDVRHGRYGVYQIVGDLVDPVALGVDYNATVRVIESEGAHDG